MGGLFRDERLAIAFAHWRSKRGTRAAPRREDLNLREMIRLLPMFNLLDVTWDPLQFRHRLVGSSYVEWLGRDVTGRLVDEELYGAAAAAEIFANLRTVATEIRPYRRQAHLDWHDRDWLIMESAELPLIDEDGRVNMILRVSNFSNSSERMPRRLTYEPLPLPPDGH